MSLILSVTSLNEKIKATLEATFMHIMVQGEVGYATYHSSGHLYFSLKDENSTIKCVMWKSNVKKLKFKLEPGEHIIINGSIGVYTPRGEYQLIATHIEPYGKGNLALAYEQLKKKLEAKGYFDVSLKKSLPKFPKTIAVVTAIESAAFADIINVASKRYPLVKLIAIDTLVQGQEASKQIAKAIDYADSLGADIILVARGGGSQEDLWAFNEEIVADSIFRAKTPVVSAIGHEIDYLISDFVADLRAPTPSAAIEIILPDINELLFMLDDLQNKINDLITNKINSADEQLKSVSSILSSYSPLKRLELINKEFAALKQRLNSAIEQKIYSLSLNLEPLKQNLQDLINLNLNAKAQKLDALKKQFEFLDPKNRIKEGFVEVTKKGKKVDVCKLKPKDKVSLVSSNCKVEVEVIKNPSSF
jgi:exodeoxyribonuclease VII large subunit